VSVHLSELRSQRKRAGRSRHRLADAADCSLSVIEQSDRGARVSSTMASKLAKALSLDVDEISTEVQA